MSEREPSPFEFAAETRAEHDPNEDSYVINEELGLLAVFDGTSLPAGGYLASQLAAEKLQEFYRTDDTIPYPMSEAIRLLKQAIISAHEAIVEFNRPRSRSVLTTAAVAKLYRLPDDTEYSLITASVGDSRIYIAKPDGQLIAATVDNVSDYSPRDVIERGRKNQQREAEFVRGIISEEADYFKYRHMLIYALGHFTDFRDPVPYVSFHDLDLGDKVILTSDGIHDNLTDSEISEIARAATHSDELAHNLVEASYRRSLDESHPRGKSDDITAAVLFYQRDAN